MTRPARRGALTTTALLITTLLLAACGTTTAPDPTNDPTTPATFDGATFNTSTWR